MKWLVYKSWEGEMSGYTKGPWEIGIYPGDPNHYIVIKDRTICTLDQSYYNKAISEPQCVANAHLISAAPEMLAALEELYSCLDQHQEMPEVIYAKKIIAKAKGEG
jgi:hypothetical protein